MRVLISLSQRFKSYEGRLYAPTCSYEQLWKRYLTVFDSVLIMARVEEVDALEGVLVEATGPGVDFFPLPDYHGPWEFLYQQPRLRKLATQAVDQSDAFILRVPCHVGSLAWWELRRRRRPYAIEVVADPWLSLAPGSVKTAARPVFRRLAVNQLRRICRGASASMYVTRQALQRSYPPAPNTYTVGHSDVELPDHLIVQDLSSRHLKIQSIADRLQAPGAPVRLGYIGTFDVMYKAPDVHIKALAQCRRRGMNVELVMLGEGRHRDAMQVLARQLHVDDAVHFAGCLPPGGPILSFLDDIDLFLIASRAEAMPRALIEAMARGCPAVGTNIAGIPELLPPECLVMPDDVDGLAILIREILLDTEKCKHLATRNRDVAWQFRKSRLLDTLHTFHGAVRDLSTTDSDLSSSEAKSRHNGRRVAAQSINLTTGSRRH